MRYSFGAWCRDNHREDLIARWDADSNLGKTVDDVSFKSNGKYWFKCPTNRHECEKKSIQYISSGRCKEIHCTKCDSFAQNIIDRFGEVFFTRIWDYEKNDEIGINPWKLKKNANTKAYFKCLDNDNHPSYLSWVYHFSDGHRCPFCSKLKVVKEESLGFLMPSIKPLWSEKNQKDYFQYRVHSGKSVLWRCEYGIHEDYPRKISASFISNYRCPECELLHRGESAREDLTGKAFGRLTVLSINKEYTKASGRTHWVCQCECGEVITTAAHRLKSGGCKSCGNREVHYSGENNGNYKGGITPLVQCEKTSLKYRQWAFSIYEKDYFTCQCCGAYGDKIEKQAHHIYSFANYESLRYVKENGITLCKKCHYPTEKGSFHNVFGTFDASPEDLELYINMRRKELGMKGFSLERYFNGERLLPPKYAKKISA